MPTANLYLNLSFTPRAPAERVLASGVAEGECAGKCRHNLARRGVTNADVAYEATAAHVANKPR